MPRLLAGMLALVVPGLAAAQEVSVDLSPQRGRALQAERTWRPFIATTCADPHGGSARSIEGELVVESSLYYRTDEVTIPVQVATERCTRTFVWVPPGPPEVRVRVQDGAGNVLARGLWTGEPGRDSLRVAVLDRTDRLEADLYDRDRRIEIVPLASIEPGGLPAQLVAARPGDLATLAEPQRSALYRWVELGGHLLISPGAARHERRGLGEITTFESTQELQQAMSSELGDFQEVGEPGPLSAEAEDSRFFYGPMRPALDENAATRPPLALVAVVLGLTLLLVGPLQFGWLSRRGKAILGLATVPGIVALSFGTLVAIGYARKGTVARFNAITVLTAGPGGTWATARRSAGLFVTDPGAITLRGAKGAFVRQVLETSSSAQRTRTRIEDGRFTLERIPAGLWETIYIREDSVRSLGGGVVVENVAGGVRIENRTPWPIRDAGLQYLSVGAMLPLGTLAPGEQRVVPFGHWDRALVPPAWRLVDAPTQSGIPVLLGRIEEPVLPAFAGFRRGHELTLLRVIGQ